MHRLTTKLYSSLYLLLHSRLYTIGRHTILDPLSTTTGLLPTAHPSLVAADSIYQAISIHYRMTAVQSSPAPLMVPYEREEMMYEEDYVDVGELSGE